MPDKDPEISTEQFGERNEALSSDNLEVYEQQLGGRRVFTFNVIGRFTFGYYFDTLEKLQGLLGDTPINSVALIVNMNGQEPEGTPLPKIIGSTGTKMASDFPFAAFITLKPGIDSNLKQINVMKGTDRAIPYAIAKTYKEAITLIDKHFTTEG